MRKVIQFLQSHPPYAAGEVAGFSVEAAAALVRRGVAVFLQPPAATRAAAMPVEESPEAAPVYPVPDEFKTPLAPPADKMVRHPGVRKRKTHREAP